MPRDSGPLRIGEFARRVGVSPDLLRVWERRYGLLQPLRSPGDFRLYSSEDAARVARMRRALDETLASFGLETALREVILPTLVRVGDEWERGRLEIGQEHFASSLIRGRLLALARLWGRGGGPLALLACAPGERHDIGLVAFGLVLRSHGWRIVFLGADTPVETLVRAAETTRPAVAVVASVDRALLEARAPELERLARLTPLVLAGPGASDGLCARLGAQRLDGDLVAAAAELARGGRPPARAGGVSSGHGDGST